MCGRGLAFARQGWQHSQEEEDRSTASARRHREMGRWHATSRTAMRCASPLWPLAAERLSSLGLPQGDAVQGRDARWRAHVSSRAWSVGWPCRAPRAGMAAPHAHPAEASARVRVSRASISEARRGSIEVFRAQPTVKRWVLSAHDARAFVLGRLVLAHCSSLWTNS